MNSLKDLLPDIKTNIDLASYTSLKIGGPADYFYEARNNEDLIKAISTAKKCETPYFILGGGTNLLVSDQGFRGLAIRVKSQKSKVESPRIYADAGVPLGLLVAEAQKNGLSGLEWAAGIPGTIGGAIRGNAGAFGKSAADMVGSVEVYDPDTGEIKKYKNTDCKFSYKDSVFQKNNDIILSAELKLTKGNKNNIQKKIQENIKYRKENHPPYSSCGCVFKNVKNDKKLKFVDKPTMWFERIPTGYLIDELGLKGFEVGEAMISNEHGNFIINTGKATAEDVITLIGIIKERVQNRFGVLLEEEIQYIGF